jgi:hypothetical protein
MAELFNHSGVTITSEQAAGAEGHASRENSTPFSGALAHLLTLPRLADQSLDLIEYIARKETCLF